MSAMKKITAWVMAAVLVLSLVPAVWAGTGEVLMEQGGRQLTSETSINQVREMYGAEKLKTDSLFGGYAYTFYGEGYRDFLYIETNNKGKIACYTVFGDSFTSKAGNSGEEEDSYISMLSGQQYADYDGKIWGVTGYCRENIPDRQTPNTLYEQDVKYAEGIAKHAALMWNAISAYFGKDTNVVFNSRAFYTNRQLFDGGSNIYRYCADNGRAEQFQLISAGTPSFLLTYGAIYPNPGMYARYAEGYTLVNESSPVFDCSEKGGQVIGALRDSFFIEGTNVPYTDEEKALLAQVREIYAKSVEDYNNAGDYFEVHPQDETLPLVPGVINEKKLEGAVGYINAIRVGGGLPALTHSPALSEGCQYKAILTSYLAKNNISNPSPHFPPQVAGISDEYYQKAQMGGAENLYHGHIISSITNALNDAYGDPITCGHRYNLLDPNLQYIGLGSTEVENQLSIGIQGVHKLSGRQASDAEIVGWPSKGIMLNEAGAGTNTMYTAKFVRNYSVTQNTGVIFRCLNTGDTYTFEAGQENTRNHEYHINANGENMVSYYDNAIALSVGYVYEITLTNVRNNQTGEYTDYSYRSVYENAYLGGSNTEAAELQLDQDQMSLAVTQTKKISASIQPETALNKMVFWSSNTPEVATVNENGYVTAHQKGQAVITARTENGLVRECVVTVTGHPYKDLVGEWYIPYVEKAYEEGLMKGTEPDLFEPESTMTRAMFVQVLANLEGIELDNGQSTVFSDVQPGQWFTGAIAWANQNQIVLGVTPTTFEPDSPITREQMCALLVRYATYKGITLDQSTPAAPFEDDNRIAPYAREAVHICQKAGIINGTTPTTFEPLENATRAQVAKVFAIFYDYM
ncbi:MAG: hypothetical protein DBX52_03120 [Clostridiales bacterium]|nr:MAG: hypothetical protein DBX52_03120 [Clostridiales bacterium]